MADPRFPNIIFGKVVSSDRVVGGIKLRAKNLTTNEEIVVLTEARGDIAFDAANFASGYTIGDVVEISVFENQPFFSDNINIENGRIEFK